jgi:hypothetical protein
LTEISFSTRQKTLAGFLLVETGTTSNELCKSARRTPLLVKDQKRHRYKSRVPIAATFGTRAANRSSEFSVRCSMFRSIRL